MSGLLRWSLAPPQGERSALKMDGRGPWVDYDDYAHTYSRMCDRESERNAVIEYALWLEGHIGHMVNDMRPKCMQAR